jgi:peptide/nickel transport system permease protein
MKWLRFVAMRAGWTVAILLAASILVFGGTELLPGDQVTVALGNDARPEQIESMREKLGLARPATERYLEWLGGIVTLDPGRSAINGIPVKDVIGSNLKNSAVLLAVTVSLLLPLSLILGTLGALRAGRPLDTVIQSVTLVGIALPEFVTGVGLIWVFTVMLDVLPAVSFSTSPRELVLPCLTLLAVTLGYCARMVRTGVLSVASSEYVAMARLKGMPESSILRRHILPNALGPSFHAFAITIGWMAGGVVIVENLFGFPGIGKALVDAVSARDVPTVSAVVLVIAAIYVVANLIADILTVLVTPRLRTSM